MKVLLSLTASFSAWQPSMATAGATFTRATIFYSSANLSGWKAYLGMTNIRFTKPLASAGKGLNFRPRSLSLLSVVNTLKRKMPFATKVNQQDPLPQSLLKPILQRSNTL